VKSWEDKLEQIRDTACTALLQAAYESNTAPDLVSAIKYLKGTCLNDHSWDMDSILYTQVRDPIVPRLACTSYAAVMIARAERETTDTTIKAYEWILNHYKALLLGRDIRELAICAYFLCRTVQTQVIVDNTLMNAARELVERLIELRNPDGGWPLSVTEDSASPSNVHVTATARRTLFAFDRNSYAQQIDDAEMFIINNNRWDDLLVVADTCGMLLETHAERSNRVTQELVQMLLDNQTQIGCFKHEGKNEPDVLTTAIAIRTLTLNGMKENSKPLLDGLNYLHGARQKNSNGWPLDTSRRLADPWTTTEVLHTYLHVARVTSLAAAFNVLLELHQRVHDEVVLGLSYEVDSVTKRLIAVQQQNTILQNQINQVEDEKRQTLEENARLKGLQQSNENLLKDRENHINTLNSIVDELRATNKQQAEHALTRTDNLQNRLVEAVQKSALVEHVQKELDASRRHGGTLRWWIGILIAIDTILIPVLIALLIYALGIIHLK
jgi:hypothetical protein